jgi:hypothetical protein
MTTKKNEYPYCFGILDNVFPMEKNGLRSTPESCMTCRYKTKCLRAAMGGEEGVKVKEEIIDRAYASGMIGFINRWSRKKTLQQEKMRHGAALPGEKKPIS